MNYNKHEVDSLLAEMQSSYERIRALRVKLQKRIGQ